MKQHKWHKEIKAWADGAEIEGREHYEDGSVGEWHKLYDPAFSSPTAEYRIKPQPKEPQYLYVYSHKELNRIDYMLQQKNPILDDGSSDYNYIGKIKLEE